MKSHYSLSLLFLFLFVSELSLVAGDHWPNWRGPNDDGRIDGGKGESYVTQWDSNLNVLWKTGLDTLGNSSPVVWGDQIFITQGEKGNTQRSLLCFDVGEGRLLWKKTVDRAAEDLAHKTNPGVSASPVTDGHLVIAWHGNAGLHAYDLEGNKKWSADLGDDYAHIWGPNAGSPVIHDGYVFILAGPGLNARLFAVDISDGSIVWKKELPEASSKKVGEFKGSWTTPRIIDNGGREEMIVPLPKRLVSFDPATGNELWQCRGLSDLFYTNALIGKNIIVAMSGYRGDAIAMRKPGPKENGDLTDSHRLWIESRPPQRVGSGQIVGDHIYMINEPGQAQCIDLKTGETVWEERLGRKNWSSLSLVGGLLYGTDKTSTTFVIDPSPEGLKLIASNRLMPAQANANATPAFAGGVIYLRTPTALYAIGKSKK